MHCRNCGLVGHNRATCKVQDTNEIEHKRQDNATVQPSKGTTTIYGKRTTVHGFSASVRVRNIDVEATNNFQQQGNEVVQLSSFMDILTNKGVHQSLQGANIAAKGDNPTSNSATS